LKIQTNTKGFKMFQESKSDILDNKVLDQNFDHYGFDDLNEYEQEIVKEVTNNEN